MLADVTQWRVQTMGASEFAAISLNALDRLFSHKLEFEVALRFINIQCVGCGKLIDVKIEKTSGGYGFLNGILSEPSQGQFLAMCPNCKGHNGQKLFVAPEKHLM
jgi:hypothetical protein